MTYPRTTFRPRAFTLIEVMISIAIVLAMIIGVNQVFKITADTVGTGQAISATIRDSRAMQSVLQQDLSHIVPSDAPEPAPFLIIDSRRKFAFRNAADKQGDIDTDASTVDLDNDNAENGMGETFSPTAVNGRSHRIDTFSFFARDLFRRQTGNFGVYVADMTSYEAWITYGHGRVYDQTNNIDDDASYLAPGEGDTTTNPKNFYASDWVLLRNAILLAAPSGALPGTIDDKAGTAQEFWALKSSSNLLDLPPLGKLTQANNNAGITITDARYDLAGTTIADFGNTLKNYIGTNSTGWWWDVLASSSAPPINSTDLPGRFRCNPYPTKPIDSTKAAHTAPILASHCSQFIVEYAGDFIRQDPTTGDVIDQGKDNQLDFFIDPVTGLRRVRWYGLPRDVNDDGQILGWTNGRTSIQANLFVDVVPLRDVIRCKIPGFLGASFERELDNLLLDPQPDYVGGMSEDARYVCAWGPNDTDKPWMIRIIVTLDDPNGRLSDGQTFEYVINLP